MIELVATATEHAPTRTIQSVRHAAQINGINPDKFETFWHDRFGHYAPQYAHEWAERIATGHAHTVADTETRHALHRAGFTGAH